MPQLRCSICIRSRLHIETSSHTISASCLEAEVVGFDVSMCNRDRMQTLHRSCCIVERYQDAVIVNGLLLHRLIQRFAQQLHNNKCRKRHCRNHCRNVRMLAGFHDLELLEKLNGHLLIKVWFQESFQGDWRSLYFQGAEKNHPCCTFGEQTIADKDVSPVIEVVGWVILWFDLGRFFARWLLGKKPPNGWLLPQKHGQNLWLSYPLLWLLGPGIVKKMLYLVGGRPWAACSMDVFSKPF